jgi:hypothetical protein
VQPDADHTLLRFVVLRHDPGERAERPLHWDFMIETTRVLRTWALASEPADEQTVSALALADHRLAYLDYEGPVSGGRGSVTQWDGGACHVLSQTEDRLTLAIAGRHLRGTVELAQQPDAIGHWTFRFSSGRAATSGLRSAGAPLGESDPDG